MSSRSWTLWALSTLAGCSLIPSAPARGVPVPVAYRQGRGDALRITDASTPFAERPAVPVLAPPEVLAAFVPARLDRRRDVLVGGHWIFLKLRDAEWFSERIADSEPAVTGVAPEEDLAPLRTLPFEEAVVPWRKEK